MRAGTWMALAALAVTACGAADEPDKAPARAIEKTPAPPAARVAVGPDAETIDATTIVGKVPSAWEADTWINAAPTTLASLRGKVVLVRWFTDGCPYCAATAPSLVAFHDQLAERGLQVVGMYHHKSDAPLVEDDVRALVKRFGFTFPVAIDRDWKTLNRWWLDDHPGWTSISFLIDRAGVVRYVHTGGSYAPGSADEAQLRTWIEGLLAEPAPSHL